MFSGPSRDVTASWALCSGAGVCRKEESAAVCKFYGGLVVAVPQHGVLNVAMVSLFINQERERGRDEY